MHSLSGLDQRILSKLAVEAGNVLERVEMIKSIEQRKKLEQELTLAEETQRSLLPQTLPRVPNLRHPRVFKADALRRRRLLRFRRTGIRRIVWRSCGCFRKRSVGVAAQLDAARLPSDAVARRSPDRRGDQPVESVSLRKIFSKPLRHDVLVYDEFERPRQVHQRRVTIQPMYFARPPVRSKNCSRTT